MQHAIIVSKFGTSEELKLSEIAIPKCEDNQVLIRQTYAGINLIDIDMRNGYMKEMSAPYTPGFEAIGIIEKIGSKVKGFEVKERVAYATCSIPGSYQQYRAIDTNYLLKVPEEVKNELVAAGLFKFMTAHYLIKRAVVVQPRHIVLIHLAASDLGRLLSTWINSIGAMIIGTVESNERKQIAMDAGCQFVVNYNDEDWVEQILKYTEGLGVHIIYDSIGKDTFANSVRIAAACGIFISHGELSGPIPMLDRNVLGNKSLIFMQPSLFDYKRKDNLNELVLSGNEFFHSIQEEAYTPKIHQAYDLKDIKQAHLDLESGINNGSLIVRL